MCVCSPEGHTFTASDICVVLVMIVVVATVTGSTTSCHKSFIDDGLTAFPSPSGFLQ